MYEGFMSFGGTEIINAGRTAAYVDHMLPNFGLDNCYDCGDMQHALGHEDYTSPLVDGADWFDEDDVASQQFFGLYPLAIDGIDDAVRESTVTQLAGDGAVMSPPRQKGREIRVSGLLIGMDDAAVMYGLTWLRNALLGGVCRDSTSCTGDHLCYFSSCPPICEDSPDVTHMPPRVHNQRLCDEGLISTIARACALPFERNLYQVTVIDGPHVVERYNTVCGSMIRIEFTMVAGVPWSYSTAAWVASSDEGQVSQIVSEISCAAGSTSILRRNLAPNPVPMTAGGWIAAEPLAYTVSRDTTFSRLPGRTSVKATVTNPESLTNIAPNPAPIGGLAGWGYTLGSADPTVRTNLATNPRPYPLTTGWTFSTGGALANGNNYFPNPSAVDDLTGWNQVSWGPEPAVERTNLVLNPQALGPGIRQPPTSWRSSDAAVSTRTNLVRNPNPSSSTYWNYTDSTLYSTAFGGNYGPSGTSNRPGMRRTLLTTGGNTFVTASMDATASRIPVTPGTVYTASARIFYTHVPSQRAGLYVTWRDAAGVQIAQDIPARAPEAVNTWHKVVQTFTAPEGAATMSLGVSIGGVSGWPAGSFVQFGQVMVTADDLATDFFDGIGVVLLEASDGQASASYAWTNVISPNTSSSTQTIYFTGSPTPGTGGWVYQLVPGSSLYTDPNQSFTAQVGDRISFSVDVQTSSALVAENMRVRLGVYAGMVVANTQASAGIPTGSGWQRIWVTAEVTAAPPGSYARGLIWPSNDTLLGFAEGFRFRNALMEIGPDVAVNGTYFDGSTAPTGDRFYAWTGTANNSISVTGTGAFPSGTVAHSPTGGDYQYQQDSGVMALTWTSPVAPATEVDVVKFDPVPVTGAGSANNVYANVSARTNAANLTTNVLVKMFEKNPAGDIVQTKQASNMVMTPGMWRRGGTFITPMAAGNSVEVHVFYTGTDSNNIPAGTVLELSNFTQGDAGSGTYWDGDTPNFDTAIAYTWTGTPRASASVRTVTAPAGSNSLQAGTGPGGLAGFYRRTVTVPETATNTQAYWQYLTPAAPAVTWAVGDRVTMSVFVMSSYDRTLALRGLVTGRSTATVGPVTTVPANTWTRLSVTVAITSAGTGTINVQTNYPLADSERSGTFDITQLLIERSASVLPYFDGGMTDTPVLDFAWTGTANASTSTLSNKAPTATTAVNSGTGPTGTSGFQRTTITVPKTAGYSGGYYQMAATTSPVYTSALWVRFSVATNVRLVMQGLNAGGAVVISDDTPFQGVPANTWVRLGPLTINFPGLATVKVWAQQDPTTVLPVGATMDVSQVRVAAGATLNSPTLGRVQYMGQATSTNVIALMPTVEYTASVYVATSRPANARVLLTFKNSAGATISTVEGVWEPTTVSTWGRVSVTGIAPAGTAFGTIEGQANLFTEEGQIGDASWWGDVLLERASVALAYFDGSFVDTTAIDYAWTGTANNSISTLTRTIALDPGPLLDPDCAVVPQAPRPPILDIACLDTPTAWRRYTAIVPEDVVPMWRDAVPIVKVATDDSAARQVRVRFYPNPFVVPVEALDPCDFCGEFVISYIPPNSIMTIDGIRQIATVSGPTGVVQIASHLLYASDGGPMVWPQLTCGIAYTATLDVSPEGVTGLSAEICAAARE